MLILSKSPCSLIAVVGSIGLIWSNTLSAQDNAAIKNKVTDAHFNLAPGYLKPAELPDSLQLLGPPPARDSAAFARDEAARQAALAVKGTSRWEQAKRDAELQFPRPAENFSCAFGIQIDEKNTPKTYAVMQRVLTDAGLSTYGVKNKYNRTRPFVLHQEGTCTPNDESTLRGDGSYPSGHTAAGWGWALVLTQVRPDRANDLLARGISFGQSRVICNAHWQSDVDAGRIMGAAAVATLQSNPVFLADIQGAREEVARLKDQKDAAPQDCAAEQAALL